MLRSFPAEEKHAARAPIGPVMRPPDELRANPTMRSETLLTLLEGIADQSTLVLVFEDLHWADDGLPGVGRTLSSSVHLAFIRCGHGSRASRHRYE